MSKQRSTQEVLDDHLSTSLNGNVEDDLARNYAEDVVVVSNWGVEHGHDGMRRMAALLQAQLPECTFTYTLRLVAGGDRDAQVDRALLGRVGARRRRFLRDP